MSDCGKHKEPFHWSWLKITNLLVGGPAALGMFGLYVKSMVGIVKGGSESLTTGTAIGVIAFVLVALAVTNVIAYFVKKGKAEEKPKRGA